MASVLRIVHIRKLHMKVLLAPQDGSGHSETQRAKRLLWSAGQVCISSEGNRSGYISAGRIDLRAQLMETGYTIIDHKMPTHIHITF